MSLENVKKKTTISLTTDQRLERLERLVVRLLLGMPLDTRTSRLINTEKMPVATRFALNKRYDSSKPYAGAEAEYALDATLAMCKDDIAAEQTILSKAQADADAAEQKKWRAQLEADKAAAKKVLDEAEAKLIGDRVDKPEVIDN